LAERESVGRCCRRGITWSKLVRVGNDSEYGYQGPEIIGVSLKIRTIARKIRGVVSEMILVGCMGDGHDERRGSEHSVAGMKAKRMGEKVHSVAFIIDTQLAGVLVLNVRC